MCLVMPQRLDEERAEGIKNEVLTQVPLQHCIQTYKCMSISSISRAPCCMDAASPAAGRLCEPAGGE